MIITPDRARQLAAVRKRFNVPGATAVGLKSDESQIELMGYRVRARITTDGLDRDNEVVLPDGCDATDFNKTGAIFFNHNYNLPVAKPYGALARSGNGIIGGAEFARRPDDFEGDFFADQIRVLVQQKIIRGVSIGFIPDATRLPTKADEQRWGENVRRIITRWRLLEWSFAPTQSNPQAMVEEALQRRVFTAAQAKSFLDADAEAERVHVHTITMDPPQEIKRMVLQIDPEPVDTADRIAKGVVRGIAKGRGAIWIDD